MFVCYFLSGSSCTEKHSVLLFLSEQPEGTCHVVFVSVFSCFSAPFFKYLTLTDLYVLYLKPNKAKTFFFLSYFLIFFLYATHLLFYQCILISLTSFWLSIPNTLYIFVFRFLKYIFVYFYSLCCLSFLIYFPFSTCTSVSHFSWIFLFFSF